MKKIIIITSIIFLVILVPILIGCPFILDFSAKEIAVNSPTYIKGVMWSGKTGLEKSQIKPEIKHPGKNADHKPLSSIQTDPHSVGTTHIQKSPMLPLYNSLFSIMDLPLTRGSISGRRRGVGLSDYSILTIVP